MKTMFFASTAAAAAILSAAPLSAKVTTAPADYTLTFNGNCIDCAAAADQSDFAVTATLNITNYVLGEQFTFLNFVSFSYGGSNLFGPYTIAAPEIGDLIGSFNGLPGNQNIEIHGPYSTGGSPYFISKADGTWDTGIEYSFDFGRSGTWSIAGAPGVPEPSAWALMILGFGLTGAALRTRKARIAVA